MRSDRRLALLLYGTDPDVGSQSRLRRRARPEVPPRTGGRRRRRAGLRRRLRRPAEGTKTPDLAPLPGRPRGSGHLLRPALRRIPGDERGPGSHRHPSRRRRSGRSGQDSAVFQTVLDQQRTIQPPDSPQVRPHLLAGRACAGGPRRPEGGSHVSHKVRPVPRRPARIPQTDVLRPDLRADRHQQEPRTRQGHPAFKRQ